MYIYSPVNISVRNIAKLLGSNLFLTPLCIVQKVELKKLDPALYSNQNKLTKKSGSFR